MNKIDYLHDLVDLERKKLRVLQAQCKSQESIIQKLYEEIEEQSRNEP